MKLYIGNYWAPFPSSEYGGVWSLTANNDDEAEQLLIAMDEDDWEGKYHAKIRDEVEAATTFELDASYTKAEIVRTFFT